jgi:hypothetical protein
MAVRVASRSVTPDASPPPSPEAPTPPSSGSEAAGRPVSAGRRRYRQPTLWQRYLLSATVAAVLLAALVIYVNGHNTDSPPSSDPAAAVQANREAEILVAQDQAPHVAGLPAGREAGTALVRVLRADMVRRISRGQIEGPVQRAVCRPRGSSTGLRRAFSCTVEAGHVGYPFLGVVDQARRRITYCKRDPPPVPTDDVPVSGRCRG